MVHNLILANQTKNLIISGQNLGKRSTGDEPRHPLGNGGCAPPPRAMHRLVRSIAAISFELLRGRRALLQHDCGVCVEGSQFLGFRGHSPASLWSWGNLLTVLPGPPQCGTRAQACGAICLVGVQVMRRRVSAPLVLSSSCRWGELMRRRGKRPCRTLQ